MEMNRRHFIALPGAAVGASLLAAESEIPWHQKIRRVGQVNMTEHDPAVMNVEEWANYWGSLHVDAVLVSVTGIVAFYPTKIPYFRRAKYLGGRDFFGECCSAAKNRGIHVIARMSPDLQWEDALQAHPEWFQRDERGDFVPHTEEPKLYRTCMFSGYFTEQIPAIMREVNGRYDIDGIFTNAWPPLGRLPVCHCGVCRNLPTAGTPEYWDRFNERTLFLWKLYESIAKEKKPQNLYFGNLGGGIRATPNLKQLGEVCYWFNCDNQGRGGEDIPMWVCAEQGRVCQAVMKGRTSTNVTGAWATGVIRWRNVAKSPPEAQIWMDQTVASGMVPWYHFIGAEHGLGEDRRWQEPGRRYFNWLARHDKHFFNKRTIANVGVVIGQRTNLFYQPPSGTNVSDFTTGLYYALLEGRFLFDFVHEDDLAPDVLKKYSTLLLPNVALLSDEQCRQIGDYVASGGSLLATFETSLYDERNRRRPDFGLAHVLGIQRKGSVQGPRGNSFYARIERPHEILGGFSDTDWLPGAQHRQPVAPVENPVLTVVPPYTAYPPELSYPPVPKTDEPAVVVRESGRGRTVYFPGDIERTLWRAGNTDLTRLLQNSTRWLLRGDAQVTVAGEGLVETFAWETEAGFAVHLLNYTNPNLHRGWVRRYYPVGPQKVRMKWTGTAQVARVELLRAEAEIPFRHAEGWLEFTVPRVVDYEVATILPAG